MKYSEVLAQYQPLETGDFMCRYEINGRKYIIYSPEKGKISCLELFDFKDLSAYQLAVSIQGTILAENDIPEFKFEHTCDRGKLIAYLFDIVGDKSEYRKVRGVSGNEGYLLYNSKKNQNIRNLYQFNPETKECQLVFDNNICYASIFEESETDCINVCWNPFVLSILENQTKDKNTSYLLPSSNLALCALVCDKAKKRNARINLFVGKNSIEALQFFVYYANSKGIKKEMSAFWDDKNVTVLMENWAPNKLVNFLARVQKCYDERQRKVYDCDPERGLSVYRLEYAADLSFFVIQNSTLAIDVFLRNLIPALGIGDIDYIDL